MLPFIMHVLLLIIFSQPPVCIQKEVTTYASVAGKKLVAGEPDSGLPARSSLRRLEDAGGQAHPLVEDGDAEEEQILGDMLCPLINSNIEGVKARHTEAVPTPPLLLSPPLLL